MKVLLTAIVEVNNGLQVTRDIIEININDLTYHNMLKNLKVFIILKVIIFEYSYHYKFFFLIINKLVLEYVYKCKLICGYSKVL